jgi:hypothetical protein
MALIEQEHLKVTLLTIITFLLGIHCGWHLTHSTPFSSSLLYPLICLLLIYPLPLCSRRPASNHPVPVPPPIPLRTHRNHLQLRNNRLLMPDAPEPVLLLPHNKDHLPLRRVPTHQHLPSPAAQLEQLPHLPFLRVYGGQCSLPG